MHIKVPLQWAVKMEWRSFPYVRGLRSLLLISIFVVFGTYTCCNAFTESEQRQLDNFIEHVISCRNLPGLTISLVKDDELVYAKGYGIKETRTRVPVTNSTRFCIGSLTKGFTSTLLAMVIGKNDSLSWDSTLREILGDGFHLSDEHRSRFATIRDILAHRTGIPGYFGALLTVYKQSVDDVIRDLRFMPASEKFHTKYVYNNYMFILAGHILKQLTGKTLEKLTQELIFEPLSMTSSGFAHQTRDWTDFALPHMSFNGELRALDTIWLEKSPIISAAGGICTNAIDMANWMRFHLTGGKNTSGHHLVDEEVFRELHTPQIPTPMPLGRKVLKAPAFPVSAGRFAYNLGWGSGTYREYHNIMHGGRVFGYDSNLWLYPDKNIGIFTSVSGPMNDEAVSALRVIHFKASDILLGEVSWLNESTACTFPDPWLANSKRTKSSINSRAEGETTTSAGDTPQPRGRRRALISDRPTARPLPEYTGEYSHYAFGNISVVLDSATNILHLRHGEFGHALLYPYTDKHMFNMKFLGVLRYVTEADGWNHLLPLAFKENDAGEIEYLIALFIESAVPPVFTRDLKWREAPPLENYSYADNLCTRVSNNSCTFKILPIAILIASILCILSC